MELSERDYELLSAYINGDLDEAARATLESRLATERDLRLELTALRQTVQLVKGLPTLKAPRDFTLNSAMVGAARQTSTLQVLPPVAASRAASPSQSQSRLVKFALPVMSAAAAILLIFVGVMAVLQTGNAPQTPMSMGAAQPSEQTTQAVAQLPTDHTSTTPSPENLELFNTTTGDVEAFALMVTEEAMPDTMAMSAADSAPADTAPSEIVPAYASATTALTESIATESVAFQRVLPTDAAANGALAGAGMPPAAATMVFPPQPTMLAMTTIHAMPTMTAMPTITATRTSISLPTDDNGSGGEGAGESDDQTSRSRTMELDASEAATASSDQALASEASTSEASTSATPPPSATLTTATTPAPTFDQAEDNSPDRNSPTMNSSSVVGWILIVLGIGCAVLSLVLVFRSLSPMRTRE